MAHRTELLRKAPSSYQQGAQFASEPAAGCPLAWILDKVCLLSSGKRCETGGSGRSTCLGQCSARLPGGENPGQGPCRPDDDVFAQAQGPVPLRRLMWYHSCGPPPQSTQRAQGCSGGHERG